MTSCVGVPVTHSFLNRMDMVRCAVVACVTFSTSPDRFESDKWTPTGVTYTLPVQRQSIAILYHSLNPKSFVMGSLTLNTNEQDIPVKYNYLKNC